jgi:zinc/manganese transport system permease protein
MRPATIRLVADIGYQPNWADVVSSPFMQRAFIGGILVAVAAGLLGYFVVVRRQAFAAHALAHIGFPGATGAVLLGLPVTLGLAVFTLVGALFIGAISRRLDDSDVATGTVLAFATGLGVLFSSQATRGANTVTNTLFGNLLAISPGQLRVFAALTVVCVVGLAVVARPLTYASVNPMAAEARGVPVRVLGMVFLVLLAVVITMAVQVVGTLLLFSLVVTPAAAALAMTARPARVATISVCIAVACVVSGLVLAAMFNLPPSFVVVTLSTIVWAASVTAQQLRTRALVRAGVVAPAAGQSHGGPGGGDHHGHDHHHPTPPAPLTR